MNPWILTIILSILPISELRGAIPYAILNGISISDAFLIAVFFNILIIPIIFFFLDYIHKFLLNLKWYKRLFDYYINKKVEKVKKKYETLELLALFLFVAIPAPGTGAYTGVLLSWFFKLNRKRSFFIIALGVITAGIITTILTLTGKGLFSLIF
tara:strand:- start:1732 stop:2196 length:465 start_codon:yes stop_codon:yes gene_type:complete